MATEPKKKSFWSSLFGKKDPEPAKTDATEESTARPEDERVPESATLRAEEPEEIVTASPEEAPVDAAPVQDPLAEPVPIFAEKKSSSHRAAKRMMARSQASDLQKKAKRLIIPHKKEKSSEEENTAHKKRVQKKIAAGKKKEALVAPKESIQEAKIVAHVEKPAVEMPAPAPVKEEKKQGFFASLFSSKKSEPVAAPSQPVEEVKKEETEQAPAKKSRIDFMRKRAKHSLEEWRQSERARTPAAGFAQEMNKDERMWAQLRREVPEESALAQQKTQDTKAETKKAEKKPEWTNDVRQTPVYPNQASGNILESFGINGLILALFLLCIQTIPDILHATKGTSLFSPTEFANIKAYLSTAASGLWIAPTSVMPAQWPGFYWLSTAIAQVLPNELLILTLSTLAGTALAVIATWILCRKAYGGTTATTAALILLSTPIFAPVVHFYGPAALAGAFVLFAIFFFIRGWLGNGSWLSLPLAFICTAIAGLTGGLFHLLLPLITSFFFLIWCGRYRRAQRSDAIFGFFCFLAIIAGWFGYMYVVVKNGAYINSLLRSSFESPLALSNWWIFVLLLAGTLPWLLALIFPSWIRVIATSIRALKASQGENAASTFIWFSLAVGVGLAFCVQKDAKISAIVCLLFIMVPLLAKTVVRLSKFGARLFIFSCMLLLFVVGLGFLLSYFPFAHEQMSLYLPVMPPKEILTQLTAIKALPIIGGIFLVAALYLKTSLKRGDTGRLAITAAFLATILTFPANFMLVRDIYKHPLLQLQTLAQIKAPAAKPAPKEAPKKDSPAAPAAQKAPAEPKATQAPKPDKKETPKPEAPKADAPKPADVKKTEAPKADAPKPEAPKTEAPKAEAPKTEAPKADAPKPEAPKVEAPKPAAEAPQTEAPKSAAPSEAKPAAPKENAPSKPAN